MIHARIMKASAMPENAGVHKIGIPKHPREIISVLRIQRGFRSVRALALAAEMPQPTLQRFLAGTTQTMETPHWLALAKTLRVTVSQLLGEVALDVPALEVNEMLGIYSTLDNDLRAALLATARALSDSNRSKPH